MQNKLKICPFPFARIESARLDAFIPCCKAWFKDEYLAMSGEKQNQWNSEMAKKLREYM